MNMTQTIDKVDIENELDREVEEVSRILVESASLNFPALSTILSAVIKAGGKRLRPRLTLLAARVASGEAWRSESLKMMQVAAAVEMLHTASLVHDDTLDEAATRRGAATLNSALDSKTVILVGDYLFAQSAILITRPGNPRAVQIFAECLAVICDGELTQMFSKRRWKQSKEEYYKRIYSKTAVLFATACELGAVMNHANEEVISKMRRFGHLLGMAFQIVDDIIDFHPAEVTGKMTGGDLRQGIVTLPTMYFFEMGAPQEVEFVKKLVERTDVSSADVERAVIAIRQSGAFDRAYDEARDFVYRAKELLQDFPDDEAKRSMLRIADFALGRKS
jgi:geranylgeranyl pyrophosphate synthase